MNFFDHLYQMSFNLSLTCFTLRFWSFLKIHFLKFYIGFLVSSKAVFFFVRTKIDFFYQIQHMICNIYFYNIYKRLHPDSTDLLIMITRTNLKRVSIFKRKLSIGQNQGNQITLSLKESFPLKLGFHLAPTR